MRKAASKKTTWQLNDVDIQIGSRIRERRNALGMTQEELGKALREGAVCCFPSTLSASSVRFGR